MQKNTPIHLQEIIFGTSEKTLNNELSALLKRGGIKKIGPRLYTGKINDDPNEIIRRNIFFILGNLYKGALLSHRSAFEFRPTKSGYLFITYKYNRTLVLGDITVKILNGPPALDNDREFFGLYVSHQARCFLENLQVSKGEADTSKNLPIEEIEEKLEKILQINGEKELNQLRDQAREISIKLNMEWAFRRFNNLIGGLLTTKASKLLTSDVAKARAAGIPFDKSRIDLFEKLFFALNDGTFKNFPDQNHSKQSFKNFAFYESYFSNYIEGTIFKIEEALEIIETQKPLPARNSDSHDVIGTYNIVSNPDEMKVVPTDAFHFLEILQYRHRILLSARKEKHPGLFKDKNNYAGNTAFVDHLLVRGTLIKGFEFYKGLSHPFSQAVFMMFLISEVHPFLDGNGRLARIMMNAELVRAGQSKIIVPTVYRDDYIGSLRKLTRQGDPDAFIRSMVKVMEFSSNIYDNDRNRMEEYLKSCEAFSEPTEGKLRIISRNNGESRKYI